jgi:outer membrane protein OmpU
MKSILFASTALIAVASAAQAAEPLTVSVGGYMYAGIGVADQLGGEADFGVMRDGEIHFKVSGASDNGLTFAARVELEAWSQAGDQIDENWVTVGGDWGTVKIGSDDHASYNLATGVIYFMGAHIGAYDAFGEAGSGTSVITNNRFSDQVSVSYRTPNIAGFLAEVQYIPSAGSDGLGDSNSLITASNAPGTSDIISAGLNYRLELDTFAFQVSGGYDWVDDFGGQGSESAFMAGAQVEFFGFLVGGHWQQALGTGDTDEYLGNVGYTTGPWNFGLQYMYAEVDGASGDANTFAGWASYDLAPGVSVGIGAEYSDDSGVIANNEGYAVMGIMGLSF